MGIKNVWGTDYPPKGYICTSSGTLVLLPKGSNTHVLLPHGDKYFYLRLPPGSDTDVLPCGGLSKYTYWHLYVQMLTPFIGINTQGLTSPKSTL